MDERIDMNDGRTLLLCRDYQHLPSRSGTGSVIIGATEGFPTITAFLINEYRSKQASDSTQLILSQDDQMICLQLCLAEMNKQETGEFDVEMSTVLDMSERLNCQKLKLPDTKLQLDDEKYTSLFGTYSNFLKRCNLVDLMDVWSTLEQNPLCEGRSLIICCPANSRVEDLVLNHLCRERTVKFVNESGEVIEDSSVEEAVSRLALVAANSPVSVTEDYVRGIFLSYLQLLVNSRCELALARIFNVPDRELDQKAFTDLRRVSVMKKLSMCQTVVSHVMRIRIGGKNNRPDPDCPLAPHVKGLSELVDLLNKLQTVIEEESSTRVAIEKVIRIIRTALMRCKSNAIRHETLENVSSRLEEAAMEALDAITKGSGPTPDKKACDGGSARGRHALYALRHVLDQDACRQCTQRAVNVLGDTFSTQRTPIRFPSIMSKFRSPEFDEVDDEESNVPLSVRLALSQKKSNKNSSGHVPRFGSCMDWSDPSSMIKDKDDHIFSAEEIKLLNKTSAMTMNSQTLMSPPPKPGNSTTLLRVPEESSHDQENVDEQEAEQQQNKQTNNKNGGKRKAKADVDCSPARKRAKKVPAKKVQVKKAKSAKVVAPAKGQKRLTDFFRM